MKKAISMLMALCMSIALIVPAGASNVSAERANLAVTGIVSEMVAQYPLADRIADAKSGQVDEDVGEEVLASVSFSTGDARENTSAIARNLMEADEGGIDYSIKNLGEVVVEGQPVGTLYSATGVQKTEEGSKELKDVNVEAYLTIIWIDNFGEDNVLVEVSGGWYDNWGYYKENRMVRYSATDLDGIGDEATKHPLKDEFTYSNINFHGLCIDAVSSIDIDVSKPNSDPVMKTFRFSLSPTIFD